ncbi:MAG: hypothetical protein ABIO60_05735 [Aquaticitalea sp.]
MILKHLIKNRDKRNRVAHIGAGLVILINSYEKYQSGIGSYLFFGIAALLFLTLALLHPIIEKKVPWIDGLFFVIEGILSIIIAIDYFNVGKKALPITFLFVAAFQFYMALKKSKKGIEFHKSHP